MNNKTKYILASILIISGIFAVSAALTRQPNDYYVFLGTFNNIEASQTDDNQLNLTYPAYYIPLTGGATYTFTLLQITTSVNISQPAQIQNQIKTSVKQEAASRGYNLIKIIAPAYNIINP